MIREPKEWKVVRSMHQGRNFPQCLAVSGNGKLLATNAVYDGRIRLWDTATGEQRLIGPGHLNEVRAVAWSPDGKTIATGCGGDGTLRLWDGASGNRLRVLPLGGKLDHFSKSLDLTDMQFTSDGRTLLAAGRWWGAASGKSVAISAGWRQTARWRDNRLVAFEDDRAFPGMVLVQDASGRTLHRIRPLPEGTAIRRGLKSLAFSPGGKLLAIALIDEEVVGDSRGLQFSVHLWDMKTGKPVRRMHPPTASRRTWRSRRTDRSWPPRSGAGPLELFDVATGRRLFTLEGHEDSGRHWDGVRPLAFSPDGALLATSGEAGVIVLWETASGQEVRTLRGHEGWLRALAFSPDGTWLLSGGSDTTALVWSVAPLREPMSWHDDTADRLWEALRDRTRRPTPRVRALRAAPERAVRAPQGPPASRQSCRCGPHRSAGRRPGRGRFRQA